MTDADWTRSHEEILLSVVRLIREALPHLIQSQRPAIVNITSTAAVEFSAGRMFSAAYRSSLSAMTKHLSVELAPHAVTVNNIAPGDILTPAWSPESAASSAARIPLKRLGDPAEVGALCAFLCSAQARYMTGQTIVLDGGSTRSIR
jgi:3-oxoacyl-[acyl-carrier protein] reductase